MTEPSRRLHLVVPLGVGAVAAIGGRLPSLEVTVDAGETTLAATWRALPVLGLSGPALACVVDQRPDEELGETPRRALVVVEPPPATWSPPPGWTPTRSPDLDHDLPHPLADVARGRIEELAGHRPVPALRAAWSRPGWHSRAADWIDDALRRAGRRESTSVVQLRQWGISTVLRVETPDGRCWFKAAFPPFRQEAAITEWLDRSAPGAVPPVIAADPDEGWLLLGDLGDRTQADDEAATRSAIDQLAALQRLTADRLDRLRRLGAPDRRLDRLADDLVEALGSPVACEMLGDADPASAVQRLHDAIARVGGALPDVLVHGDFHPGNVAPAGEGAVLFDWSDAAISSPIVDVPTWTWWYPDDDDRVDLVWSCFEAVWEREYGVRTGTIDRRAALTVAGAYHTISYVRILDNLEPVARPEHADGVTHFYELLVGDAGEPDE